MYRFELGPANYGSGLLFEFGADLMSGPMDQSIAGCLHAPPTREMIFKKKIYQVTMRKGKEEKGTVSHERRKQLTHTHTHAAALSKSCCRASANTYRD